MDVVFQHLYEEVYGCIRKGKYGTDRIIFPQNFIPIPGVKYKNLEVRMTLTGNFRFNGQNYNVSRAYHPGFDLDGIPANKAGDVIDIFNFRAKNKDKSTKMGNGFSKLLKLKGRLRVTSGPNKT